VASSPSLFLTDDGPTGGYSEPEVGFEEISPLISSKPVIVSVYGLCP
jgi:hypothetical protein